MYRCDITDISWNNCIREFRGRTNVFPDPGILQIRQNAIIQDSRLLLLGTILDHVMFHVCSF